MAYDFYLQGLAYLRQAKSAKPLEVAEQLFERALAEQPDFARAQAGLCETRVERYVLEKVPVYVAAAEEACANAEALDSGAPEVHMAVGRLRLATGDDGGGGGFVSARACTGAPVSRRADWTCRRACCRRKEDEAESTYRRAIAAQSSYAAAYVAYGNFLLSHGRAADAVPEYERATILTPDDPNALSNLGGAYFLLGNLEKAADAFARSLALEPRRASYSNTGLVHYYLGQYGEAAEMYRKAIEFAPCGSPVVG